MTDAGFSVVFRGDIVIGENLLDVKQKLKKIFKTSDERIDALFTGKPVPLKTNLSKTEAEKYQTILKQAGVIVSLESSSATKASVTTNNSSVSKKDVMSSREGSAETTGNKNFQSWELKPTGSLLQDKKLVSEPMPINTDHIQVKAQEGNLLNESERSTDPEPPIDIDSLNWDLTAHGEALLKETEKKIVEQLNIDTDTITLAENNGNLIRDEERKKVKPVEVDISHLTLINNKDDSNS